ncbi:MAG TPA: oligosaccharide flippase family protein [Rhodopila sp.]
MLSWSGLESACRQGLSLVFFLLTMRFMAPADLGVFSLAVALIAVVGIIIDEPIGEALVQRDNVSALDWDTGYTVNLGVALACLLLSGIASVVLAALAPSPLVLALPALSLSSLVGALGNIHKAYLGRLLNFRAIAKTALAAQLVAGIVMLSSAAMGFGWWALVLNVLIAAMITSAIYRHITPWRSRLRISRATIADLASYVGYSAAIRSVYLLRDQPLLIAAGAVLGLTSAGYLSLAMRVARTVGQLFEDVTSRPLISLVSRKKDDLGQFGAVLTQVLFIVGVLALPGLLMLAEIGTPILRVLLGKAWAPAGNLLPWVCAAVGGWLLLHIVAVALRARGLGRLAVCLTAPAAIIDLGIFASAAVFGFDWTLRLWAARSLLVIPVLIPILSTRLGVRALDLVRVWLLPIAATFLMLGSLRFVESHQVAAPGISGVILLAGAGAVVYVATFAATYGMNGLLSAFSALPGRSRSGRGDNVLITGGQPDFNRPRNNSSPENSS